MADKVIEIFEMTDGIMKSGMSEKERNAMGYLISETTKEEREDRKSTRLNSSHPSSSRMPSSA